MYGQVCRHILDQKEYVRIEAERHARLLNQRDGQRHEELRSKRDTLLNLLSQDGAKTPSSHDASTRRAITQHSPDSNSIHHVAGPKD